MKREELLKTFTNKLIQHDYDATIIKELSNILVLSLNNYDVVTRNTEVGFVDTSTETLLKLYTGSLLTEGKSKNSIKSYVYLLKKFSDEVNKALTDVNTFDIRLYLANLQQTVSLRTCENYRSYLSAFYKWLFDESYINSNPMSKIKPIKYEQKVRKGFTDEELERLRLACTSLRSRAELEVLASTGIRVSECAGLDIEDVDFKNLQMHVRNGKGAKERVVFFNEVCALHLKMYLDGRTDNNPYLFNTRQDTRITRRGIERDIASIGKLAGIQNVHPHRFRRNFATTLSKRGADIHSVQKLMGHADINVTTCYIAMDNDRLGIDYRKSMY